MKFLRFSLFFLFIFSCSNQDINHSKLFYFIPENTSVLVITSNIESLKSSIANNDFLESISNTNAYKNVNKRLKDLSLFKPNSQVLICFEKDSLGSLQYSVITKYNKALFDKDSLKSYKEEKLQFKKNTIIKSVLNNQTFYSAIIDSTFFSSSSKSLVENAFEYTNTNTELEKIYSTTDDSKSISIIIKNDDHFIQSFFPNKILPLKSFSTYTAIDTEITQDKIFFNGITQANDSTESFINVFKNTIPQENQIQMVTPSNSNGFLSFTFGNYKNFRSNIIKYTHVDSLKTQTTLFDNIIEVGVIFDSENQAIVLNSIDVISTEDALISEQTIIENFRQVDIFNFSQPELFKSTFSPLITFNQPSKYCVLDNFFIFAQDIELLKTIISNYQNKTTLSEQPYYTDISEQLSDASSLLIVLNPELLKGVLNQNFAQDSIFSIDKYKVSALQFVYDHHFAHVNGIIKKPKIKASLNSISEELNIKLDADLLNNPQLVINHLNKQKEIVVQDIKNKLYLISNTGKILWKKQLDGAVLGNIEQVDIYKNGRLQLAFVTPHKLYIIDRNGNDVSPFPGNFNDAITLPLSVFDYEKNKDYRFLVTQGKNILMYDTQLKTVNGFNFNSANSTLISQPQHFRIGSKDYIAFKTQDKIYFLDRTGNIRINPKTISNFSQEAIYVYNNKFITTNTDGNLITIDTKGNSASQNLKLSERHYIDASSKSLVTFSDNKLTIKGKTIELDFGVYTAPKLFYLQDKIYVTITDLQSQKVYLFDSNAKLLPNFPVYSNSPIALDNIDGDRDLEFVTKGENNSVILYKIN